MPSNMSETLPMSITVWILVIIVWRALTERLVIGECRQLPSWLGSAPPGAVEKRRDGDGQQRIEREPTQSKDVCGAGDERLGNAEKSGEQNPRERGQALCLCGEGGEERRHEMTSKREGGREHESGWSIGICSRLVGAL